MSEEQHAMLLRAAQRVVCERGADALTIKSVCAEADASQSAFHATFAGRTDCLLAVFDESIEIARTVMMRACRSGDDWVDGVRRALSELLDLMDRHQRLARLVIVDSLAGDAPMLVRRSRLIEELAAALQSGSPAIAVDSLPAPFGADAVVGGIVSIIHARLLEYPTPSLLDLAQPLMGVIVLPYLGVAAARGELSRRSLTAQ
jgi:AcrR family transcriptional regulator